MTRVVVVGLGPAGADLLVPRARAALDAIPTRFVRTERHPAVADLAAEGVAFTAFDSVYEVADAIDDVDPRIVEELLAAAREHGEVVYAVPGNPVVAERSVRLLHERARAGDVVLEVVPGVSFADLAWARVGIDPLDGARVVDGRALDPVVLEAGGPLLIAQVDGPLVASDVKLALLDHTGPDTPVTVLQRLGLVDEQVLTVPLAELDRTVAPDHLTTVFVELAPGAADTFGALVALARRLRGPDGCPWDVEQTHHSLTRYLLEEAYEVVDAIEAVPIVPAPDVVVDPRVYIDLVDELGDLLFQVVFHGVLGEEAGEFTTAQVAQGIHDKLVRRHPHVFGDVEAQTAGDVVRNWEQIKKGERGSDSLVDSVSPGLPALLSTHKLFRKAASVGLDPGDREDAVARLARAAAAAAVIGAPPGEGGTTAEAVIGEVLAAAVILAGDCGVDAESSLRGWAGRYRARFRRMEGLAATRGLDLHTLAPDAVAGLWADAEAADEVGEVTEAPEGAA